MNGRTPANPEPSGRAGVAVLTSRQELDAAAAALDERRWSWPRRGRATTLLWRSAARLGMATWPLDRDRTKSWDVWRAVHHCLEAVPAEAPVFDVGAWQSEVLWSLWRAGYRDLSGCDTDARVRRMPGAGRIRYRRSDFFSCSIPDASLGALTCLSVIEHGMDAAAFFRRAAALLRPGGRLLLTTDYWPEPVNTAGLQAFGRAWTIASRGTILAWLDLAAGLGLEADGPVDLNAVEAPISWNGRHYTFLWLALAKRCRR